jgi:hypothetical protein
VKITPDKAKQILADAVANLEKKVADKKSLTATEIALLNSASVAPGPDPVEAVAVAKNQTQLAALLGVDRKTIQRWRKMPGSPDPEPNGSWNVAQWRTFAKANGHKFSDDAPNQTQARAEQILLQNESLRIKNAKNRKEWMPVGVAKAVFSKLVIECKQRNYAAILRFVTMVRMAPTTAEGIEAVKKEMDEIWRNMTDSKWFTQQNQPPPPLSKE